MHLSRVQIKNFRNFANLDVALNAHAVIVGENRVGKSNFIFALRLVLDPSLPDSARHLKLSDIWDGCAHSADKDDPSGKRVEIHLDFTGFDDDDNLTALLTDYRLASDHTTARLSYVFCPRDEEKQYSKSDADFEFRIFGGGDDRRSVGPQVRRRICLDVLHALRDAETELSSWRASPLRPLIEDAVAQVERKDLSALAEAINVATEQMADLEPIRRLETDLRTHIAELAGERQDINAKLGFASTDPHLLFRALRVYIDGGKRAIGDASLGSANLALLAFRLAEFSWRRGKNERNFTLVAVEEPEAHLHPHLQRKVFRTLLQESETDGLSLILTTHSSNVASVAPIRSIVLLKDEGSSGTGGYSLAKLTLEDGEFEDLQRYLDVTRAEMLFSRGVIFVEGGAEEVLVPVFAQNLGYDLDELGITVCSVGGVNFGPYVRLAASLSMPFSVLTDWDPRSDGRISDGWKRAIDLIGQVQEVSDRSKFRPDGMEQLQKDETYLREAASEYGIFLNEDTLETEIARVPSLRESILEVLMDQPFGKALRSRLESWRSGCLSVDYSQLMLMIGYVGKGRFAAQLATRIKDLSPPKYIESAIRHVVDRV